MIFEKNSNKLSNYIRLNNSIPINMLNIEEESELIEQIVQAENSRL